MSGQIHPPRDALLYPESDRAFLEPYFPSAHQASSSSNELPFVTLTFATSLDSSLSLSPGVQTALSGPQSKAMTHYLRSRHDAILIGVGTAIADNPSLNCRLAGVGGYGGEDLEGQPRPVVIDPHVRWDFNGRTKVLDLAARKMGKAPYIVTSSESLPLAREVKLLEELGGRFVQIPPEPSGQLNWTTILQALRRLDISSVMIEGGAHIINALLGPNDVPIIDSVIVTIAPTWLGKDGALVCPEARHDESGRKIPVARLKDVQWHPLGEDVVLSGRMKP